MSIIATALKHMLAAGMGAEAIVNAVAEMEAASATAASQGDGLTPRQRRNQRYYLGRKGKAETSENASESVLEASETSDASETPFLSSPPSPRPLSTTTNLSQEPPIVPQTKGRKRAVRRSYPEAFELCWKTYPHHEGRSSKPNAADEFDRLPDDERAALPAAIAKFRPKVAEVCGGKGAPDMAVWLKAGKHLSWADATDPAGGMATIPKFSNEAVRGYVVKAKGEPWAVSYLDTCSFSEAEGIRTISAPNSFVAGKLSEGVPALAQRGILVIVGHPSNVVPITSDRSVA